MHLAATALVLQLATAADPPPAPVAPPRVVEVSGVTTAVDPEAHRLTIQTAAGPATLEWDRNTLIYLPGGATTSASFRVGAAIRAGLDPARVAYWIQLRLEGAPASPTPAPTAPPTPQAPPAAPPDPQP